MERMAAAWKIPERTRFLDGFYEDFTAFLGASDGSDADTFLRQAGAWVAYIVHVHSTEPPLPESLLTKEYAYEKISGHLRKTSIRDGRKMLRYFMARNR